MERDGMWRMFEGLSERLAAAAASHPGQAERLVDMLLRSSHTGDAPSERGFQTMSEICGRVKGAADDDQARAVMDSHAHGSGPVAESQPDLSEEEFMARASEITAPPFVEKVICPAVFGNACEAVHHPAFTSFVPQEDRGTGRVTVGYRFGSDLLVFGKIYPSAEARSYEVMRRLRDEGFGDGEYQVAEAIAFLSDRNLLLIRGAPGMSLMLRIEEQQPDVLEDVRRAGRWLVHLHSSPLRIGPEETPWKSMRLQNILRHLTKAAARFPHERDRLVEPVKRLCRKARESYRAIPVVQTHGSFHYEHVFTSSDTVTLIDFDKSFPADPARDLAEFVTLLRRRTFKRTGSLADAKGPTEVFLEEYHARLPGNMTNLSVHWGSAILVDLFHYRKKVPRDGHVQRMIEFLEGDYDAVLSGELTGQSPVIGRESEVRDPLGPRTRRG